MRILILGGSGFIGSALSRYLVAKGHTVIIGTRQKNYQAEAPLQTVYWTPDAPAPVPNVNAIINLAGAPINRLRWTKKIKAQILGSRLSTTRALVAAVEKGLYTPEVVINGSAIGIYGDCGHQWLLESDGDVAQHDFLSQVASLWEHEAQPMAQKTRLVFLRTAIVLGEGGALPLILRPYRLGLGGPLGKGDQWFSWIHLQDLVGIIEHLLLTSDLHGPINACAPKPVTQNQFSETLGHVIHRPHFLRVPTPLLKLLLGEASQVLLSSQRASANTLLDSGYTFQFPNLEEALKDLCPLK